MDGARRGAGTKALRRNMIGAEEEVWKGMRRQKRQTGNIYIYPGFDLFLLEGNEIF